MEDIGPSYYSCLNTVELEFDDPPTWEMGLSNYISLFVNSVMFGIWASLSERLDSFNSLI